MMHSYRHHIGDFRSATKHLSDAEELAYRRMIETYYDSEQPLPADVAWIARRVQSTPEVVQRVLEDFFEPSDEGWRQSRCDEEIADYRKAVRLARANGKRGGRPRKDQGCRLEPDGNRAGSHPDTGPGPGGGATRKLSHIPSPKSQVPLSPSGPLLNSVPSLRTGQQDDRSREGGPAGSSGTAGPQALFEALLATSYRSNSRDRTHDLLQAAERLNAAGIEPRDLLTLANRAARKGRKPGGLFAAWIDDVPEALKELGKRPA